MAERFNSVDLIDNKDLRIRIDLTQFNLIPEQLHALSCQAQIEYAAARALTEYRSSQQRDGHPCDLAEERRLMDYAMKMMAKMINYTI